MDNIYEGAVTLGQFWTYVGLIIGIIIAFFASIGSIYLWAQDDSYLVDTSAKVLTSNCVKDRDFFNCNLNVEYNVNENILSGNINYLNKDIPNIGKIITVTYDRNNPTRVTNYQIRNKTLAIVIFFISVIILGFLGFRFWMARNFKFYAAAEGVGSTLNLFRSANNI